MIKLGVLAALDQRITVRFQMNGMTDHETADYIRHHLKIAGRTDPLFSDDASARTPKPSNRASRRIAAYISTLDIRAICAPSLSEHHQRLTATPPVGPKLTRTQSADHTVEPTLIRRWGQDSSLEPSAARAAVTEVIATE